MAGRSRIPIVAAIAVVAVVALSVPSFGTSVHRVRAGRTAWMPKHIFTGHPGDVVRWSNPSGRSHNIRAIDVQSRWNFSRSLPAGSRVSRRFRSLGVYWYRCTVRGHSRLVNTDADARPEGCRGMCGLIHIIR